jgi:succinyl-CoA synthetase beta subunit
MVADGGGLLRSLTADLSLSFAAGMERLFTLGVCGAARASDSMESLPHVCCFASCFAHAIPGQHPKLPMKIHEYQAKDILAKYGVAVPRGEVANTLEEAMDVAKKLFSNGAKGVVVKAQIHAGGRGKGGGVKVAKSIDEAEDYAKAILGMQLITHQTGPQGQKVQRLLIEETAAIDRELYLGIVLDRAAAKLVFMASKAGGMEIEEVAAKDPDAIHKAYIDPAVGFQAYQARQLAFALGLKPTQINEAVRFMMGLYKVFIDTDASLLEINPFITTKDDKLFALDCKINFDDNAIFRHKDLKELRDTAEEDPLEVEASKYALNYIKLDGNIACMVNGAGLAMATMDIIQYAGGSPANFLDVGGGANQQQIEHAFEILLSDKNVQAIFINIFGGILRVDTLAQGVVAAAIKTHVKVPIVLRLEGTNVEQGRQILKDSGLNFIVGETMQDAAQKVVAAAKGK